MSSNVIEWRLKLNTGAFIPPAVEVHKIVDVIGDVAAAAAPSISGMGSALDASGASATRAAKEISKVSEEAQKSADAMEKLRAAARASASPTDAEKFLNAAKPSDLIAQEGAIKRRIALMEKLRAASRASAGATDQEKWMNAAVPDSLRPQKKIGGFAKVIQQVGNRFGPRAAGGVMKLGQAFASLEPAVTALGAAAPALMAVGAGVAAVGVGAAIGAAKFGSAVVMAQAYKEDVTRALSIMLKGKDAADAALKTAAQTADFIGEDRAKVAGGFVDLLAKGFDVKKADEITRRLADLGSVDPKARTEDLVRVIGQIASTGRLQGDELNELANAGLETGSVYDALGKQLGKTRAEVIKLKEAGKITSDQAITAILGAIADQSGGKAAGVQAQEKSLQNISGLLKRIQSIPSNVLFDLDVGDSMGMVKGGLRDVIALFDSTTATGKKVREVTGEVFDALVTGLFGKGANEGATLEDRFNQILDIVRNSTPQIQDFAGGIRKIGIAAGYLIDLIDKIAEVRADINLARESTSGWMSVLKGLYFVLTLPTQVLSALGDALMYVFNLVPPEWWTILGESFARTIGVIGSLGESALNAAGEIGTYIIDGLVGGITGGASRVLDSITGLTNSAIEAAKRGLGIASPSKVFEEIGAFTVAGFEQGVTANDNAASSAVDAMLAPPSLGDIANGAQAAGSGGGGGFVLTFAEGSIVVHAGGATAADAERIGEQVAARVILSIENLGLQLGAA